MVPVCDSLMAVSPQTPPILLSVFVSSICTNFKGPTFHADVHVAVVQQDHLQGEKDKQEHN